MSRADSLRPGVQQGVSFFVNDYGKIKFESIEEEDRAYNAMLQLLYEQPRFFLDNLEHVKTFRVRWLNYSTKEYCEESGRHYAISHPYNI